VRQILIKDETPRAVRDQSAEKRERFNEYGLRYPTVWALRDVGGPSTRQVGANLVVTAGGTAFGNQQ
jgi:hypothetical protein